MQILENLRDIQRAEYKVQEQRYHRPESGLSRVFPLRRVSNRFDSYWRWYIGVAVLSFFSFTAQGKERLVEISTTTGLRPVCPTKLCSLTNRSNLSILDLDRKRHTAKAFNGVRSSTSGEQTQEPCFTNNGQFPTGTSTKIGRDQWRSRRLKSDQQKSLRRGVRKRS